MIIIAKALLISVLMMMTSGFSAISGFGTSTISIPILLFFFPLPETLLFVGIIRLIATVWKLILFRGKIMWRLILTIGIPAVIASMLGAHMMLRYTHYISRPVIGISLLLYIVLLFSRPHVKLTQKSPIAMGGGVLSGFSAGLIGISGPIQSAFLSAFDLPKLTYIFTTASLDFMVDISRLTTYVAGGLNLPPVFLLGLVFSIPSIFFGAWLARRIVDGIPQVYFRSIILLFLTIVALRWLIWG